VGEGDVVAAERAEALDVLVAGFAAGAGGDVIDGALGVDRAVENDGVDDQAEGAELLFLAFAVGLAQLAAAAVADVAGEAVAAFAAVELDQDAAAEVFVVAVVEQGGSFSGHARCAAALGQASRGGRVWLRSARMSWLEVVWRCSRLPAILSTSS
jgi:hypothetical protein